MATQPRDVLKEYFEINDVPTEAQFIDLIDSSLNLADTNTQIVLGTISASAFSASNLFINGINFLNTSNFITTESNTFGQLTTNHSHSFTGSFQQTSVDTYGNGENYPSYFLNHLSVGTSESLANLTVNSNISSSGHFNKNTLSVLNTNAVNKSISSSFIILNNNLSASGYISASSFRAENYNALTSQLTSSGIISGSDTISGSNLHIANNATIKGNITSSITGSFGYIESSTVSASGHIYAQTYKGRLGKQLIEYDTSIKIGTATDSLPVRIFGNITASNNISSSKPLHFSSSILEGNSTLKTLTIASSGKLFHTGSYKFPTHYSDLDWNISSGNYLTSSKAVQITSSTPLTTALSTKTTYIQFNFTRFDVLFSNSTDHKVKLMNSSIDWANPLVIGKDINSYDSLNLAMPNKPSFSTTARPRLDIISGSVRIKNNSSGPSDQLSGIPTLYLEDDGITSPNSQVFGVQNDKDTFKIKNFSKLMWNPIYGGEINEPLYDITNGDGYSPIEIASHDKNWFNFNNSSQTSVLAGLDTKKNVTHPTLARETSITFNVVSILNFNTKRIIPAMVIKRENHSNPLWDFINLQGVRFGYPTPQGTDNAVNDPQADFGFTNDPNGNSSPTLPGASGFPGYSVKNMSINGLLTGNVTVNASNGQTQGTKRLSRRSGETNGDFNYYDDATVGAVKGAEVVGDVKANGTVTAGLTTQTSDIRKKENIRNLESTINIINKLKPRRFDWKEKNSYQFNDIGFIAQEIQEVLPELVTPSNDEEQTLHVSYDKLNPILIKTLQNQKKTIKLIEKRIKKLEIR
jgi:hypothetical protein